MVVRLCLNRKVALVKELILWLEILDVKYC